MSHIPDQRLAAICGLYCGDCPAYLAPRQGDQAEVALLAEKNHMPQSEVGCDGCLSDRLMPECRACGHGFRACAQSHGVTRCHECADFPCPRLEAFRDIHHRDGVSHHEKVIEELDAMGRVGVEAWLERRAAMSACPGCGRTAYWFQKRCPSCGEVVPRG